jgi:hypothetical protein
MGKFLNCIVLALISFAAAYSQANANVEYFDSSAWKDAALAAGYSVHPYTAGVTITTYTSTIEIVGYDDPNAPYIVYDPVIESHHQFGLSTIVGDFFFGSECDTHPGCLITNLSELDIAFDQPIHGILFESFAQTSAMELSPGGDFFSEGIDGEWFSLFGGAFSEMTFSSGFTDSPNSLYITNILVATAPEPATIALVLAGFPFVLVCAISNRRRVRSGLGLDVSS